MNTSSKLFSLFALIIAIFTCSCVMKETVTVNGQIKKEGYVVKRPIKDAITKSR